MATVPPPEGDTSPLECPQCNTVHRWSHATDSLVGLEQHKFTCPALPDVEMWLQFCTCGWSLVATSHEENGGNVLLPENVTIEDGE